MAKIVVVVMLCSALGASRAYAEVESTPITISSAEEEQQLKLGLLREQQERRFLEESVFSGIKRLEKEIEVLNKRIDRLDAETTSGNQALSQLRKEFEETRARHLELITDLRIAIGNEHAERIQDNMRVLSALAELTRDSATKAELTAKLQGLEQAAQQLREQVEVLKSDHKADAGPFEKVFNSAGRLLDDVGETVIEGWKLLKGLF